MDLLVLGGTAWLGREVAEQAVARGDAVTCLARGRSGAVANGARLVLADRDRTWCYDRVAGQRWDAVVDVARQPGQVRGALTALASNARHWIFVSTGSVYADHSRIGADETAATLPPGDGDEPGPEGYGGGKVSCELACREALSNRLLIARAGLIGGPGDHTGRSGAWVTRAARDPCTPMLVPAMLDTPTQMVDVRDLATWLLHCADERLTGTVDAVGTPTVALGDWIEMSRHVGGHTGPVVAADDLWLLDHGVETFMGEESLALWLGRDPGWAGFMARAGTLAAAMGLTHRSRESLLTDVLAWERHHGLSRPRRAGISVRRERELLLALAGS